MLGRRELVMAVAVCLATLAAVSAARVGGGKEEILSFSVDPRGPTRLVSMTGDEVVEASLLEVSEASAHCKPGFKCPLEGGICCRDGEHCCLYGCNDDDKVLTCGPNRFANALRAAKEKVEEETHKQDELEKWDEKMNLERERRTKLLTQKTKQEADLKRIATEQEDKKKSRRRKTEEETKTSQAKRSAQKWRGEEAQKREENTKASQRSLPLLSRMVAYDRGYRHPKYMRLGHMCLVTGMAIGPKQNTRVAKLPETCRPPERLVFDIHISRADTARYDVLPNGDIMWAGGAFRTGGELGHWVPFDGITFMVRGSPQQRVALNDPWVDYGRAGYQGARFYVNRDNLCVVSGLVRTADWRASAMVNPIFTLDPSCRPDKRLVFQLNHHEYSMRVDVLANGEGHLIAGKKEHSWISLSGIVFFNKQSEKIPLENGWGRYNQLYRAPTLKKTGTLCVLSGLARAYNGWIGHIATLPEKCRPALRLIFAVSAHDKSQRIDVLPSGKVMWVDGAKTWVSFDGIRFGVP